MFLFKKSFTLIELVLVIAVIGILAGAGSWLFVYWVENFTTIPEQTNVSSALSDILWLAVDGDDQAGGVRFSQAITQADDNQINFTDQSGNSVAIQVLANKVYRSINGGGNSLIPYYAPEDLNLSGRGGQTFEYYDASDIITAVPSLVRRVNISLSASMGDINKEIKTSVRVRR